MTQKFVQAPTGSKEWCVCAVTRLSLYPLGSREATVNAQRQGGESIPSVPLDWMKGWEPDMRMLEMLYPSLGIPMRGQPQSGPSIHRFKADEKNFTHTHPTAVSE